MVLYALCYVDISDFSFNADAFTMPSVLDPKMFTKSFINHYRHELALSISLISSNSGFMKSVGFLLSVSMKRDEVYEGDIGQ
jgi:hypothetical protein